MKSLQEWERKKKYLVHKAGPEEWNNFEVGNGLQAAAKLPLLTEEMTLSKNTAFICLALASCQDRDRKAVNKYPSVAAQQLFPPEVYNSGNYILRKDPVSSLCIWFESKREMKKTKITEFWRDFNSVKTYWGNTTRIQTNASLRPCVVAASFRMFSTIYYFIWD